MKTPSYKDIETLMKIKTAEDINSVEIIDDFIDDGEQCAVAKINGAAIEFLWYDWRLMRNLEEWSQHKKELYDMLQHTLEMLKNRREAV